MNVQTPAGYIRAQSVPPVGRALRSPTHTFHLRHKPFSLQPLMLAPVVPGETLKNAVWQARAFSDPIKNPLIGWWLEYYFFYVKLRDLHIRDELVEMLLDPEVDTALLFEADPSLKYYHFGGTINWAKHCLQRVVEEYFRNEGEEWLDHTIDGLPACMAVGNGSHFADSAIPFADLSEPDIDVDLNADGNVMASEVAKAMAEYRRLLTQGLTEQTYEEYLRTFGIRAPREEQHRPEMLRYLREWTYPSNNYDPATGTPSSAVSWTVSQRIDKDRFFNEPGFIFGLTSARPKVYLRNQIGSAAGLMVDSLSWLPAILRSDPMATLKNVPQGAGPFQNGADVGGYWVDVKDLLMYGDQFVNFELTATDAGLVALPSATMQRRYVSDADVTALFVTAGKEHIKQDGVVNLKILGKQRDTTRSV